MNTILVAVSLVRKNTDTSTKQAMVHCVVFEDKYVSFLINYAESPESIPTGLYGSSIIIYQLLYFTHSVLYSDYFKPLLFYDSCFEKERINIWTNYFLLASVSRVR